MHILFAEGTMPNINYFTGQAQFNLTPFSHQKVNWDTKSRQVEPEKFKF